VEPAAQGNWFAGWPAHPPAGWLDALKVSAPDGLRWFHPDDLHITLCFFGPFRPAAEREAAVREHLCEIPPPPDSIRLGRLVALPNARHFSAVSCAIADGGAELAALMAAHRDRLALAAGARPESRPPLPHLTIARPVRNAPRWQLRDILRWIHSFPAGGSTLCSLGPVSLYRWAPDRSQRQFCILQGPGQSFG
jgi:2'-5' RNA ligase